MSEDLSIRVQKWIASLGLASRREAERWIEAGKVKINGKIIKLGAKADPDSDAMSIDGKLVTKKQRPKVYWMLNKPHGCLTSRIDDRDRNTIYDLIAFKNLNYHVPYIGRLDLKSTGLLLMSNDGDLNFRLTHPKYQVSRSYEVKLGKDLSEQDQQKIVSGTLSLEDGVIKGVQFLRNKNGKILDRYSAAKAGSRVFIRAFEGRNRFIRRLFEKLDNHVTHLNRFEFGGLFLSEDLKPGQYVPLTSEQIKFLKRADRSERI